MARQEQREPLEQTTTAALVAMVGTRPLAHGLLAMAALEVRQGPEAVAREAMALHGTMPMELNQAETALVLDTARMPAAQALAVTLNGVALREAQLLIAVALGKRVAAVFREAQVAELAVASTPETQERKEQEERVARPALTLLAEAAPQERQAAPQERLARQSSELQVAAEAAEAAQMTARAALAGQERPQAVAEAAAAEARIRAASARLAAKAK